MKVVNMEQKAASAYVQLQHLLCCFLAAVVLTPAALVPAISLWSAIAGVIICQILLSLR